MDAVPSRLNNSHQQEPLDR